MIDWKRVSDLRREIGADGFAEVADMFLEEAEQAVQALLHDRAADALERQLHLLKGSALNLGLAALAAICHEGERKAAQGHADEVDTEGVELAYRQSRSLLLGGLAQGNAA